MSKCKALFLDRDGVINKEAVYVSKVEDFIFISGIFDSCLYFIELGYRIFVITNQSGIGRGFYTEDDFRQLNFWMLQRFKERGIVIDKVYYSPYHPKHGQGKYRADSWCRKPNPGMILQAKREFSVDLDRSILVGDKETDIEAGIASGIGLNVLVRSGHLIDEKNSKADLVVDSLADLPKCLSMVSTMQ